MEVWTDVWNKFSGICRHFEHSAGSLPILQLPIGSIPLGTWVPNVGDPNGQPLIRLRPNASLGDALSMFVQGDHSYVLKFVYFFLGLFLIYVLFPMIFLWRCPRGFFWKLLVDFKKSYPLIKGKKIEGEVTVYK